MVRKMKLKHAVGYKISWDESSVGHCGIKVKVTIHFTRWRCMFFALVVLPKYIAINI